MLIYTVLAIDSNNSIYTYGQIGHEFFFCRTVTCWQGDDERMFGFTDVIDEATQFRGDYNLFFARFLKIRNRCHNLLHNCSLT